jgi:hypothetical protein
MRITFTFVARPGDTQLEAVTVRTEGDKPVMVPAALGKALVFVESLTALPIAQVTITLDATQS